MRLPRISHKHIPLVATVMVWALLYGLGALLYDGFFSLRVFVNFFADNSFLGIIAVGMTFVILAGHIDLSVGSQLALASILMAVLMDGPRQFHPTDIRDLDGLAARLRAADDPVSLYIGEHLSDQARRLLDQPAESPEARDRLKAMLARDLDRFLRTKPLYSAQRFQGVPLSPESEALLRPHQGIVVWRGTSVGGARMPDRAPTERELARLNHHLLRDAYPGLVRDSGMKHPRVPIPVAMLIVLAVGSGLGFGMGCIVRFFGLPAFIVTLAGMFFARGLALIIREQALPIVNPFYRSISVWGIPVGSARIPATALVFLAVVAAGIVVSVYTRFGRNVYAVGGNEEAALLMGLPVGRTKVGVHTLSGLCAALAGIVFTLYSSGGNAATGVGMELDAIAAVVVGGTLLSGGVGTVFGTLIGVLIFGIIQTGIMFQGTLSSWWTRVAIGLLLLVFIALQKLLARRPGGEA